VATPLSPTFPLTYAARLGDEIRLQLHLSKPLPEVGTVRVRRGRRSVEAPARLSPAPTGQLLVAELPAQTLTKGAWQLEARVGASGPWQDASAYLLLPDGGPVSLLLGHPEDVGRIVPRRPSLRQRAASVVGRVSDSALAPLDPRRARAARSWLRRTGRRVLS
jgi:hypothetical protein